MILWPLNVPEPLSTEIVSKPKQLYWGRWEWGVEGVGDDGEWGEGVGDGGAGGGGGRGR